MKTILLIFLSGLWLSAAAAETGIEQATVTLPYTELLGLLERAGRASPDNAQVPPQPPVDILVQSALYSLDCSDPAATRFSASFNVVNLSGEWQSVFLLEATEAIRSLDPPEAKIVQIDGGLHLLLEPNATASVTLGLQAEQAMHAQSVQTIADFVAVGAARSLLQVRHGGTPAALIVSGAVGANREKTEFSLPALGGPVQVKRYQPDAIEPTRWSATARHWIRDMGGVMEVACHVRLRATDGGLTSQAKLILANPASVHSVENYGAGAGPQQSLEMTAGGPVLHLEWPHDGAMTREMMIRYTVPLDLKEGKFSVPIIQVASVKEMDAACFVSEFQGFELSPVRGDWSQPGRLPAWVEPGGGNERLKHIRCAKQDVLELLARPLPRLQTAAATVISAEYSTELVVEGGILHQGVVTIEHADAADYRLTLPTGGTLLSSTINGRTTEPLLAEGGGLIFKLPKPERTHTQTTIACVFTAKAEKMNPVEGKAQLELPRTPLFIHKLTWVVQLPAEYQATAVEGNVVIDAGAARGGTVRLGKRICHDESPLAALYYTRKDLNR